MVDCYSEIIMDVFIFILGLELVFDFWRNFRKLIFFCLLAIVESVLCLEVSGVDIIGHFAITITC